MNLVKCRRCFAASLVGLMLAACAQGQGGFQQATAVLPRSVDVKNVKIIQRIGNQIPTDVPFLDQDGKSVTLGSLLGKKPALLLAVFYRCTGVCSIELENLVATLDQMKDRRVGRDFDVIVVGIDPVETPELAKAKLAQTLNTFPGLRPTKDGWHFLTGTPANIHAVTNPMGFYYTYDAQKDIVNHPAGLMFLTPSGIVSSYILGAQFPAKAIVADLDTAKRNQLGVKSADIFFGCIHIDPLTGKASIVIQNVLMVAGVLTVLIIGLTLLTLSGHARWRRRRNTGFDEWGEPVEH